MYKKKVRVCLLLRELAKKAFHALFYIAVRQIMAKASLFFFLCPFVNSRDETKQAGKKITDLHIFYYQPFPLILVTKFTSSSTGLNLPKRKIQKVLQLCALSYICRNESGFLYS